MNSTFFRSKIVFGLDKLCELLGHPFACKLGSFAATLDQKWGTGLYDWDPSCEILATRKDEWFHDSLDTIIYLLQDLIEHAEETNKHLGFVQANLHDARKDCLDALNSWDTEPDHPHEFDLESRGLNE